MTQRMQVQWVSEVPEDTELLHRLAVKAQILAAEFGENLSYPAARHRAMENLAHVRSMAGGVR